MSRLASKTRKGLFAVFASALLLIGLGAALAPTASALSCREPPSDWAEFVIHTVGEGKELARIPYEGHRIGYGCGPGNTHALSGPWFAWLENDRSSNTVSVGVLDLATGQQDSFQPKTTNRILDLSIATSDPLSGPYVYLLAEGDTEDAWVVERHQAALRGTQESVRLEPIAYMGDQLIIDGHILWQLQERTASDFQATLWDMNANEAIEKVEPAVSKNHGPPWRLLAGDARWLVFASDAGDSPNEILPETARVWVHDRAEGETFMLPPLIGSEKPRYGAFEIDSPYLYHYRWDNRDHWWPKSLHVQALPSGTSERVDETDLYRHAAIDGGRIVTGGYLDEAPQDPTPWLDPDAAQPHDAGSSTHLLPGPGLWILLLVLSGMFQLAQRSRRAGERH